MSLAEQVAAHDIVLFSRVPSQTSDDDRRSLLAVHHALASRARDFSYLEIGSHLGGTLQVFIADRRCRRIVSIDPRPPAQPDDRGEVFTYEDNSTGRMIGLLAAVPDADVEKLHTIELSTENVAPGTLARPDLCLIDGEHTYTAALRDARFCRAAMQGSGVILFHDREIVEPAIIAFLREVPGPVVAYPLRGSLFVVELGADTPLVGHSGVASQVATFPPVLWRGAGRMGVSSQFLAAVARVRGYKRAHTSWTWGLRA